MLSEAAHSVVAGPFEVMTVDFAHDRADKYDGSTNLTFDLPIERQPHLGRAPAGSGGGEGGMGDEEVELHAVVAWFEAEIGVDEFGVPQTLSTSPWAPDNSFARQQHWGQLIELLPLDLHTGRPLAGRPGLDALRVTVNLHSQPGAAGSVYFPKVELMKPGGGT